MFNNKKLDSQVRLLTEEILSLRLNSSYKDTKVYLDRQQKIDTLLVVAKLLEPGMSVNADTIKLAEKTVVKIIEEFNK